MRNECISIPNAIAGNPSFVNVEPFAQAFPGAPMTGEVQCMFSPGFWNERSRTIWKPAVVWLPHSDGRPASTCARRSPTASAWR